MRANGKALILNGGEGLVKIIADAKYGEVLGMHIIGPRATDLICEGALAIRLEATVDELLYPRSTPIRPLRKQWARRRWTLISGQST